MHDLVIRGGRIIDGTGAQAYEADIAIRDGVITDVGTNIVSGRRQIDADGLVVTPGFVDTHTHYDGQVTWDPELAPSSWHGVTTAVMGNCGVGFAPARPSERDFMIRVMEGVEEIPGAALQEGLPWAWETFPEYLDFLDDQPRSLDVVAQLPHCALRCYVMGQERALDDEARPEDIAEMSRLTRQALEAGAAGFSTSRTLLHRIKDGPVVPGTHCQPEELIGIADAIRQAGHGVFQMISDRMGMEPDFMWMKRIAQLTGHPLVFTLAQLPHKPRQYREVLENLRTVHQNEGLDIRAGVPWRPPGVLLGLQATLNPFSTHPSFRSLRGLALADLVAKLRSPDVRSALVGEEATTSGTVLRRILTDFDNMFPLGDPPDYEPTKDTSIGARARAAGVDPAEFALDVLAQDEGRQFIYFPLAGYADFNFEALREMLAHPRSTASLSDGGAHVGTVCDASYTSYMLTYWHRDRTRGDRFAIEEVVRKQTSETADLYGLHDRGRIAVGKKADINVFDLQGMHLHAPYMAFDLPTGGKRLLQKADGYRATIVSGEMIIEDGEPTGARPGKLVRGPQQ